jgi:NhaA family Na+:H+ antiporter
MRIEAASGLVLLVAAAAALALANSPWASAVAAFWETPVGLRAGPWTAARPLRWFVDDVLMVAFFLQVGMELRRELHDGALSEWRRAALPAFAAAGGMLAPALVYLAFAGGAATRHGWGVPTATDIAFALGVLALLGRRVPAELRVLLLALAVIDDLGAILVIALFYSGGLEPWGLLVAAAGVAAIVLLQRFGARRLGLYALPAVVVWVGVMASGVHATIAGVIVGLLTPVRAWLSREEFAEGARGELGRLVAGGAVVAPVRAIERACREVRSPAERAIDALHPYVAYGVMPLFALANAGVSLSELGAGAAGREVLLGVGFALVLGKPVGVLAASGLALALGVARLPQELGARHLAVLGAVAGIGFTMALFVAQLAFDDAGLLAAAKAGVLAASALAGVTALALGRLALPLPDGAMEVVSRPVS